MKRAVLRSRSVQPLVIAVICAVTVGTAQAVPTYFWGNSPIPFAASWVGGGSAWLAEDGGTSGGSVDLNGSTLSPGVSGTACYLVGYEVYSVDAYNWLLLGGGTPTLDLGDIDLPDDLVGWSFGPAGTITLVVDGGSSMFMPDSGGIGMPADPLENSITLTVVPEPATWAMAVLAGAVALLRRRFL